MTLSPAFLDELRARTSLSSLVGKSVKLQRAGREWKACCPFHKEKTPSFTLSDEKGFYHCLASETRVMTRHGRVAIGELAGRTIEVLTRGGHWVPAAFANYGRQQLWEIRLSRNGVKKVIFATSGHRWFVRGRRAAILTHELRSGQRLETTMVPARTRWELDPEGVRHGIIFGDGTMYRGEYGTINLHGEKDLCLAIWFPRPRHDARLRPGGQSYVRIYGGRAFAGMKALPPATADDSYLLGFLAGYLAADGHVARDGTTSLNSSRADILEAVRDIATRLGISTYGVTTQMRRGYGGEDSALHRVHFVTSTLSSRLFLNPVAKQRFEGCAKAFARLRWTVTHVQPTQRVEDVFCAEVPDKHAFVLDDNILTGNCFGCGAHGDAIRWLTDARGLPFMEAVKELADAAGMDVPAPDPRAQQKAERAAGLYDVMEAAQSYYEEQLGGLEGAEARTYLQKRGVSEAVRKRFGFGYAPDSRSKLRAALRHFGNEKLVEAGLLILPESDASPESKPARDPYDRFRGRLMFPIRDQRGRVVGFSGRIVGAGEPKYLNSPDTPLFDKGRTLFNIDKAAPASREAKRVIVVEGQMDVVALDQAGMREAIAPLGTALTEAQLGLLWRLSPSPILCFDGDAPGQKAAVRAALRALPHVGPSRSLAFVTLPPGQDPDDLIRAEGREALEALLEKPEPLVERLWRYELAAEPLATPEQRAGLRRRLLDHVSVIADPDVRDQYRADLLGRFNALTRPPQRQWTPAPPGKWTPAAPGKGRWQPPHQASDGAKAVGRGGLSKQTARAALAGLLRFPELIAAHSEAIAALPLADKGGARLREALLEAALSHGALDPERLHTILATAGVAALAEKLRLERGLAFSFTRRDADPERASRDLVLVIDTLAAQPGIHAALEAATARLKEMGDEAAFREQQRLRTARDEAERQLAALIEGEG
jgi:DNA primase